MATARVLDRRTLNRTLLARQGLLARTHEPALAVVERLVGMQAQEPIDPYVALWTRLEDFDPTELADAILDRRAVRIGLLRTTLHLVTAADARAIEPVTVEVLTKAYRNSPFAKTLAGADTAAIVAAAREILDAEPLSPSDLGRRLAERWPDLDANAMAYTARFLLPLVQVPPRGVWGRTAKTVNTTAEAWLGGPLGPAASRETLVERYLRAFGPATSADLRTWSWLTGWREVIERMRPHLRTYRDEAGRELLDVENGRIEDSTRDAPVRFLPQYDNVFLSHEDRSRLNGAMAWGIDFGWKGPILVDGFITGAWRLRRVHAAATMSIELGRSLSRAERVDLEAELDRLLSFFRVDDRFRNISCDVRAGADESSPVDL